MTWKWNAPWLLVLASCAGAPPAAPVVPPHADPAILAEEQAAEQAERQRQRQEGWPEQLIYHQIVHVPDFEAEVVRVQGREVILRITANPERRAMRRGYSFMLIRNKTYLGEAVMAEVLPDFTVRCRQEIVKGEALAGDLARTNIPD